MAAKKTTEAVEEKAVVTTEEVEKKEAPTDTVDSLEKNLITLANELIAQVRKKQVANLNETIDRAIAIYEKVK